MFLESNWQYSSIVSDNGLAPTRWQAIIWSNDGKLTDACMRRSASVSWNKTLLYTNPFYIIAQKQIYLLNKYEIHILGYFGILLMLTFVDESWTFHRFISSCLMSACMFNWKVWHIEAENKMATIWQTTRLDLFSWMKIVVFWLKFHWSLFLGVLLTIHQHIGKYDGLVLNRWQANDQFTDGSLNLIELISQGYSYKIGKNIHACIYLGVLTHHFFVSTL